MKKSRQRLWHDKKKPRKPPPPRTEPFVASEDTLQRAFDKYFGNKPPKIRFDDHFNQQQ